MAVEGGGLSLGCWWCREGYLEGFRGGAKDGDGGGGGEGGEGAEEGDEHCLKGGKTGSNCPIVDVLICLGARHTDEICECVDVN